MIEGKNQWASKYLVDPEDRIEVEIWIDSGTDGNLKTLPSVCMFKQGKQPCMGDPMEPCHGKYDRCNHHDRDMCTDEAGRLKFIAKEQEAPLPPTVHREWARFARETWAIRSFIESKSFRFDPATQQRVYDMHRYQQLTVQCLLKEWSLGQYDPLLVIQSGQAPDIPFMVIPEDQMKRIATVEHEIMRAFLDGFASAGRGE